MYGNIIVLNKTMGGELRSIVSKHIVRESKMLMKNTQEGTHINVMLLVF